MTSQHSRAARTKQNMIDAFSRLVRERRQRHIRVGDIVTAAQVGRSTFYDHYDSIEDIRLQALAVPMAVLADAAMGRGEAAQVADLLRHFWDNRVMARDFIGGRSGERIARLLSGLVGGRIGAHPALAIPAELAALQLADAAFAPIRGWLMAAAPCEVNDLAIAICATGRATAAALNIKAPSCNPDTNPSGYQL